MVDSSCLVSRFLLSQPRSTVIKAVVVTLLLAGVLVGLLLAKQYITKALVEFMAWVETLGIWGKVIMVGCFIVASLPVPFLFGLFTLASGAMFGVPMGLLVTLVGCAVGSLLVFLGARFVFREKVERSIATNPFFLRFNGRIEREGWKLALAMRLASVPFGFVNVFLAVTKLRIEMFVITTVGGEIPIAFIGCFLGYSVGSVGQAVGGESVPWSTTRIVLTVIEACLAVTFIVIAILVSRKMLKESMEDGGEIKAVPLSEDSSLAESYDMPPIELLGAPHGHNDEDSDNDTARLTGSQPGTAASRSEYGSL